MYCMLSMYSLCWGKHRHTENPDYSPALRQVIGPLDLSTSSQKLVWLFYWNIYIHNQRKVTDGKDSCSCSKTQTKLLCFQIFQDCKVIWFWSQDGYLGFYFCVRHIIKSGLCILFVTNTQCLFEPWLKKREGFSWFEQTEVKKKSLWTLGVFEWTSS